MLRCLSWPRVWSSSSALLGRRERGVNYLLSLTSCTTTVTKDIPSQADVGCQWGSWETPVLIKSFIFKYNPEIISGWEGLLRWEASMWGPEQNSSNWKTRPNSPSPSWVWAQGWDINPALEGGLAASQVCHCLCCWPEQGFASSWPFSLKSA